MRDHYAILGVGPKDSDDTIRAAYRRQLRQHHPDASGQPVDSARFAAITEAYRVLSDPQRRRRYDATRLFVMMPPLRRLADLIQEPSGRARVAGYLMRNARAIFAAGAGAQLHGGDIVRRASVSFVDSYKGGDLRVEYRRLARCTACNGAGRPHTEECPLCGGKGQLLFPAVGLLKKRCPKCGGFGVVGEGRCRPCRGKGRVAEDAAVTLRLPAGIANGAVLRAKDKGDAGLANGRDGDLLVEVRVEGSLHFSRRDDDLVLEKPIPFCTAMKGGKVAVALPTGDAVEVSIPPGSYPDREIRVSDLGFYAESRKKKGDLVLALEVFLSENLDAPARRAAMTWLHAARNGDPKTAAELAARLVAESKGTICADPDA